MSEPSPCEVCGKETDGKTYCDAHRAERVKAAARSRQRRQEETPERAWAVGARVKAKRRGKWEVTITFEDILAVFPADRRCPVFGEEFVFRGPSPWNPSLDRRDPSRGYEPGNIAVISYRANMLKNDATADELRKVAAWVESKETSETEEVTDGVRDRAIHVRPSEGPPSP